jgi:hypothetical protein
VIGAVGFAIPLIATLPLGLTIVVFTTDCFYCCRGCLEVDGWSDGSSTGNPSNELSSDIDIAGECAAAGEAVRAGGGGGSYAVGIWFRKF